MSNLIEARADTELLIKQNRPAWLWGLPGIGKSQVIAQIARDMGYKLVDIRLSMFDPVDLRGLPAIIDGMTQWLRPQIWPSTDEPTILFFDEMDRAALSVSNAALQIVLDRRIGEHALPASTRILAAGNGATDKRGTNKLSGAHANRFTHLFIQPDHEVTADYFDAMGFDPVGSAFLRHLGESMLCTEARDNNPGFASPRAWETALDFVDCPPAQRQRLICGTVGEDAGLKFVAFIDTFRSLPPLDAILRDPNGAPLVTQPGQMWAVSSALARRANFANFGNAMAYCERLAVEFKNMMVSQAVKREPALKETPAYVQWAVSNGESL